METIDKKIINNEAAKYAFLFGLISVAYEVLNLTLNIPIILYFLKLAKIVGCIFLMKWCMAKLKNSYEGVDASHLKRYGTMIAFFSAILVAAGVFISYQYVFPDAIKAIWDEIYVQMGSTMDNNTRTGLMWAEASLPKILLISEFIYCFLYGWILSLILAPRISPSDPFNE